MTNHTPSDSANTEQGQPLYRDARQSVSARVHDLLARMTLVEKISQLRSIRNERRLLESEGGDFIDSQAAAVLGNGIGQVARPAENKEEVYANKTLVQTALFVNAIQRWLLENTRLGIPAQFHDEALHGLAATGATCFPQAIAMASTFNPELVKQMCAVAAAETRRRGSCQALAPVLDVARDPRWGRIEETMGEDPYLITAMGLASIEGFQGPRQTKLPAEKVIATLKHLTGHGEPSGGQNTAPASIAERELREVFLQPFEAAVKVGGARSVMASYNEIDGIPSHANDKILRDILRGEWGFKGIVVSDYYGIRELITRHHTAQTLPDAARMALHAGIGVDLPDGNAYAELQAMVERDEVDIAAIDAAVSRVLYDKFALGLFENPFVDLEGLDDFVGKTEHVMLSQQAAEQAIILLKNDNNLLPLNRARLKSVAVIGPHVHETLLGAYSGVPRNTISVLQGIRDYLGDDIDVGYAQGTLISKDNWQPNVESLTANTRSRQRWNIDQVELASAADTHGMIAEAVALARRSDVAIVVVGENEAVSREAWAEDHLGDRHELTLLGEQQALVDALIASGTPTVVVLQNGRPLAIADIAERAPAILEAWYLGQNTGAALARVLFGAVNPSGKLPVSIPHSAGHIPAYYNHKPSARRGYAFTPASVLYPFGHGLSYTHFSYDNMHIHSAKAEAGGEVEISFTLTNSGELAGSETVQLYVRDTAASVTRPVKELKGFARVHLASGQSARVCFQLPINLLGFYDAKMCYVVEPGTIEIMLGSSSADIRLQGSFDITGIARNVGASKAFLSKHSIELY